MYLVAVFAGAVVIAAGAFGSRNTSGSRTSLGVLAAPSAAADDGFAIKQVVIIAQENRSFDHYFGTYPGANGIPMSNGRPVACLPNPQGPCIRPFVDHEDVNSGGPHFKTDSDGSINGGKMDGFVTRAARATRRCIDATDPLCVPSINTKVMGYHTASDIPNYWAYAKYGVLHDAMFEPIGSWSEPAHDWLVSLWAAQCTQHNDPLSCRNDIDQSDLHPPNGDPLDFTPTPKDPIKAWTPITYLFQKNSISWGYYVTPGLSPDCEDSTTIACSPTPQTPETPSIWNPLKYFDTVRDGGQLNNIQGVANFYDQAEAGTIPQVSWVIPSYDLSEHPPASVSAGQSYVTSLVNAIMRGPQWNSTAIFLLWDDWGGFYDHVSPPQIDQNGYGIRVPSMVISPYAKKGYVDHQTLTFDNIIKFIEDHFMDGQRLDPATDGRPDPRPTVREHIIPGDIDLDFNFNQAPRPPLILPVYPKTTLKAVKPFPPQVVGATPGNGRIVVSWMSPKSDGGKPITHYLVTPTTNGKALEPEKFKAIRNKFKYTHAITGLKNGQKYIFVVQGVNALGAGKSQFTLVLAAGAPLAPRAITATPGIRRSTVRWRAPQSVNGAALTEYTVSAYIKGTPVKTFVLKPSSTSKVIGGLVTGVGYRFGVAARNARGISREVLSDVVTVG